MRAGPQRDVDYGSAVLTRVAPSALIAIAARLERGAASWQSEEAARSKDLFFVLAPEEIVRSGSKAEVRT
jgi:hypothetical protein